MERDSPGSGDDQNGGERHGGELHHAEKTRGGCRESPAIHQCGNLIRDHEDTDEPGEEERPSGVWGDVLRRSRHRDPVPDEMTRQSYEGIADRTEGDTSHDVVV